MKVSYPDVDLMAVLQHAVKALGIHDGPWPPVCSNGPGHARYRRMVITDRPNARQMARQYESVLQESLPWAEVRGIAAFWDDCQEPDEGLQQFHLILMVRVIERTKQATAHNASGFFFCAPFYSITIKTGTRQRQSTVTLGAGAPLAFQVEI